MVQARTTVTAVGIPPPEVPRHAAAQLLRSSLASTEKELAIAPVAADLPPFRRNRAPGPTRRKQGRSRAGSCSSITHFPMHGDARRGSGRLGANAHVWTRSRSHDGPLTGIDRPLTQ